MEREMDEVQSSYPVARVHAHSPCLANDWHITELNQKFNSAWHVFFTAVV